MSTPEIPGQSCNQERGDAQAYLPILGVIENLERACGPDSSPEAFTQEMLRSFVALSGAVYGAFWRVDVSTGQMALAGELTPEVSQRAARAWEPLLREVASGVIRESIIRYRGVPEPPDRLMTGQTYLALGFPVQGDADSAGCVTVVIRAEGPVLSGVAIAILRLLASFGLLYSSRRSAARFERSYKNLSSAWDVVGEMLAFVSPVEMAQVVTNSLRNAMGAERVTLGMVKGERVDVAAISGEDTVEKRSNTVRLLQAVQTEVVVSGEAGLYDGSAPAQVRAAQLTRNPQHERLAREGGAQTVYSVPLRRGDSFVGVLTLEFAQGKFGDAVRQAVDVTAGQVGPVLYLSRLNDRSIPVRAAEAAISAVAWLTGREHPWRRVALVGGLAVAAFAILGHVSFNVSGPCRLEPSERRIYTAPFDTKIRAVHVKPGDTVQAGQVILAFDREELDLQLREARSRHSSVEKEMSAYLAAQQIAQYAVARARLEALAAQIELLQRRIAQAELAADFVGIVIKGDLRQDIGRPVRMGEELIEVAPLDVFVLEVDVDQDDVLYVQEGMKGHFTTKARPNVSIPFAVAKVRPTPEVRGRSSVYVAEALVQNEEGWLRPGMEGAAKVHAGRRSALWVLTRKLVNWLRLRLWW